MYELQLVVLRIRVILETLKWSFMFFSAVDILLRNSSWKTGKSTRTKEYTH